MIDVPGMKMTHDVFRVPETAAILKIQQEARQAI
jgi:hypothetical protein